MPVNLRAAQRDWDRLRDHCRKSFRAGLSPETGAIGLLGVADSQRATDYLLAEVLWPGPEDLKVATHGELVFASTYIRRAHIRMRERQLRGLAFFHTHPHADEMVQFSAYDDANEPSLVENLLEIDSRTRVVSVVLGKRSQFGREWIDAGHRRPMAELIVVGEELRGMPLNGKPNASPPSPAAIFDRSQAITNAGALGRLRGMTIAVVGASGTGSIICELLARAGCGRILLIDDDVVKLVNLNRMLYATIEDARLQLPKVDVIKRGIEGLGLGCVVDARRANVARRGVVPLLREADVIIGCVDRALPRYVLCEVSNRFILPYIDVGTEIDGDAKGIVSVVARCSYFGPGRRCLVCSGVIQPDALRIESLADEERERVLAQGYSDHLLLKQPAVMDLNARASSMGTMVLRHLLQPYMPQPLPVTMSENLVTLRMLAIQEARAATSGCKLCADTRYFGLGDCGPAIGLEP